MEVLLLGPLEVRDRGRPLSVPGNRPRALLALLALNVGRVIPAERLIELLWGDEPPPTAGNALQVHISALRKVLEPTGAPYKLLTSDGSGYVLKLSPAQLDYTRFEQLFERGHQALKRGEIAQATELIAEAMGEWRGAALAGLADQRWSIAEARRLEALRVAAEEDRIDAELALGRHVELVPQLESLVAQHPLRERLRYQLMLALYRSGRQGEASDVYRRTRELLVEELGMEPGRDLQQLLKAILNQDAALGMPGTHPVAPRLENLPADLTSFVGRDDEIAELESLVARTRLLTLTGPGGIGKTRLAIEVARGLIGRYQHGIWWISLAALGDPALVSQAVASVLVVKAQSGESVSDAVIAYLRDRHCVLVLDNCEHVIEESAKLAADVLVSCPQVTILATSREDLGVPGEVIWTVPALGLPGDALTAPNGSTIESGALQLFEQRARGSTGSFALNDRNLRAAIVVCRRLEGIPLAIELAASKLRTMSLDVLSARLADQLEILRDGSRTVLPRHRTMRAAIDWSYQLLPDVERSLLRVLSVFSGGFSLEAAEAIGHDEVGDSNRVIEVLSSLVRKSLVQIRRSEYDVRYELLDTIRWYALERLRETGQQGIAVQHHLDFYLDLSERASPHLRGPNASIWIRRLAFDHDNIRAALNNAYSARESDHLDRMLVSIWWFWYVRCFFDEGRRWFDRALVELPVSSAVVEVSLLMGAGQLAWANGDNWAAETAFKSALVAATVIEDDALIGHALLRLSLADAAVDQMRMAEQHLEESIRLLRRQQRTSWLAEALNNLGWIRAFALNDPAAGRSLLDESLALARECSDQWALMEVLDSMASLCAVEGDIGGAEAYQLESLRLSIALDDAWSTPRVLAGFVRLAMARGHAERALRLAAAAAKLRHDTGTILMPSEETQLNPLIAEARASLPIETAERAWTDGSRWTMREAVEYALSPEETTLSSR